jgi:TRAP-type C4-dicarboxylate transport system permease large subunit
VVAGIAKISIAEITREIWPYVLALIGVLMLITYVPAISLWLPNLFGYGVTR